MPEQAPGTEQSWFRNLDWTLLGTGSCAIARRSQCPVGLEKIDGTAISQITNSHSDVGEAKLTHFLLHRFLTLEMMFFHLVIQSFECLKIFDRDSHLFDFLENRMNKELRLTQ